MSSDTDSDRLCFLVGAGCSPRYPLATDVTRPLLRLLLGRSPNEEESLVRFEFLLQVVKDYLDPELAFLNDIFAPIPRLSGLRCDEPHPYERLFALLAADPDHYVFTTNFDRSIEAAQVDAKFEYGFGRTSVPTSEPNFHVVYDPRNFQKAVVGRSRRGLFKLHGSVDAPNTLGATYDGIAPIGGEARDPRLRLFSRGLRTSTLCVVGYSGFDDMDVVPTLLSTEAADREVHWFHHGDFERSREYSASEFLLRVDDIDPWAKKSKKPILEILGAWAKSNSRSLDRVTVHCGRTERMLAQFLLNKFSSGPVRFEAHRLLENEIERARHPRKVSRTIYAWFAQLPPSSRALAHCAAIEVLYQHAARWQVLRHHARKLNGLTRLCSQTKTRSALALRLIALPKLAQVAYWVEDFDRVAELDTEGAHLWRILTRDPIPKTPAKIDPALAAAAVCELGHWAAETFRFQGLVAEARDRLQDKFLWRPRASWRQLRAKGAFAPTGGFRTTQWSRFIGLRAFAMMTLADINVCRERFKRTHREYERARSLWSQVGNSFWCLYCGTCQADSLLYRGELKTAREQYETIRRGNIFSGWTDWMDGHPIVHMADIARVQRKGGKELATHRSDLEWLRSHGDDPELVVLAETMQWALAWSTGHDADTGRLDTEFARIGEKDWEDVDRLALELLRAEYLLWFGRLSEAAEAAGRVKQATNPRDHPFLSLRSRILMQEFRRRAGETVQWRPLLNRCQALEFRLGAAYVLAIALVAGERPPRRSVASAARWAKTNELRWLARILTSERKYAGSYTLPIRFAFSYT